MKKYKELTDNEKFACVSLYPEESKKDEDEDIRLEAYRALGYTEEAKKDEDRDIRREAELYFEVKNDDNIIELSNGAKISEQTVREALEFMANNKK